MLAPELVTSAAAAAAFADADAAAAVVAAAVAVAVAGAAIVAVAAALAALVHALAACAAVRAVPVKQSQTAFNKKLLARTIGFGESHEQCHIQIKRAIA